MANFAQIQQQQQPPPATIGTGRRSAGTVNYAQPGATQQARPGSTFSPQQYAPLPQYSFTDQQQQLLSGYDPNRVQALQQRVQSDISKAYNTMTQGPIVQGDQSQNPIGFKREYERLISQGVPEQQAIARANELLQGQTKHGEDRYNAVDMLLQRFSTPEYIQRVMQSGFLGDPMSQGGGGGQGGGVGNIPPSSPQGENAPYPTQGGTVPVGQDPLSQAINSALGQVIGAGGGATTGAGQAAENAIQALLQRGGMLDRDVINQRMETAQEGLNDLERQRISSLEARLADRGLNGGAYAGGLENISRDIASIGAGQFRNILADEQAAANNRFVQGAGLGTSLAQSAPQTLLGAAGQGTQRQNVLAQIALENLSQSADWAKFLAQFGLDRDIAMEQIKQGRIAQFIPLLNIFRGLASQSAQGYIGR